MKAPEKFVSYMIKSNMDPALRAGSPEQDITRPCGGGRVA